jgi:hypothetical protein
MKYSHFENEITGSYHNTDNTWLYVIVGLTIVACGVIYLIAF